MIPTIALAVAVGLALSACSEGRPQIAFYELLGMSTAMEPNPVDDAAELADRADVLVVGTVTGINVSEPVFATPDPNDPSATYGGQRIYATVQPSDGSKSIQVEFIYQFLPGGQVTSPKQVQLPDEELVLALVESADGSAYYCVADSQWCPLVWSGTGLESAAWRGEDVPLALNGAEAPDSLDEAVEVATKNIDVEVVG